MKHVFQNLKLGFAISTYKLTTKVERQYITNLTAAIWPRAMPRHSHLHRVKYTTSNLLFHRMTLRGTDEIAKIAKNFDLFVGQEVLLACRN